VNISFEKSWAYPPAFICRRLSEKIPPKTSLHNQQKGTLISKNKSIELIKWQKAELENLLGSPCIKRRIRRRAIMDYQTVEHKNSPHPFNVPPA